MATVAEILNGAKHFGEFTGRISRVNPPRNVTARGNPTQVQDIFLNDGTGEIKWSCWSPTRQYMVGETVTLTKCYVKEYNGQKSIALSKGGNAMTSTGSAPTPIVTNAPTTQGLYDAPTKSVPDFQVDDGLVDEQEMFDLIQAEKDIDDDVMEMLIKKNTVDGMLSRREALIMIAKKADIDLAKPPIDPTDGLPDTPFVFMTDEELLDAFRKEPHPAARGLIEKVIMHKQDIAVRKKANELKKIELKLMAEVQRINQDYELERDEKLADITGDAGLKAKTRVAKSKKAKKTAKKIPDENEA